MLLCHSAVGHALSSAKIVSTLCRYRKDGLSPGRRQARGLQHPRPRQGRQGLCHAELLQDGRGIGPWPVRGATQAHRRVRQGDGEPRHGDFTHTFHSLRDAQAIGEPDDRARR